ncbi:peptidoglycan-binding domain-containing protein [Streptomyces sp. NPDC048417]|uniref:peptidoglycan-binding domain-containing protein n=1 Tax=Streptomyces sp. NPDC048417 TaxID=3155387 RepID=UPI0034471B6F
MTDTTGGHLCPECGAPRGRDNTPSCDCTRRASDALRDARTAEQAAAEDFDPLRIRPYVDLSGAGTGTGADGQAGVGADGRAGVGADGQAGADGRAGAGVGADGQAGAWTEADSGRGAEGGAEADGGAEDGGGKGRALPVVESATVPLQVVREAVGAGGEPGEASVASAGQGEPRRRRPRRVLVLSIAGAVIGILAVAGFASGLFSHVTPTRDTAAPQDVRESVPDVTPSTGSPSTAAPVTSAAAPASAVPAASTPVGTSASPTASSSRTASPGPSATASRSARPTQSASTTGTAASAQPTSAPVLRPGDSGAEVTELQLRLTQLRLFSGKADGHYDRETEDAVRTYQLARGILTDESGVYGTATRAALESETTEP